MAHYLQIPGIDGEVTDRDYAGWMEVKSVRFGDPEGRGGGGRGGGGTGKINLTDVHFFKKRDRASADLVRATATGKIFPKVTLVGTREQHKFIEYVFEEAMITSYATSEHEGLQNETFALNFEKVTFNYS